MPPRSGAGSGVAAILVRMDALAHLHRLFDHLFWADQRVVDRLREARVPVDPALRLLAHLLAAEQVWLARLQKRGDALEIWPGLPLERCASLAAENRFAYARYLRGLSPHDLPRVVAYHNSQGAAQHTPVLDILTHVAMHGSYHRGQIAMSLRAAGGEPVNTDYITWVREPPTAPASNPED